ncbi:MAG: glycoside hydrolase family 92 protein [Chitinophagaceae bacterium]|nr:glycoside hydrolase family 92 protein [Chitinophagaceae bacterium]
MIKNFKFILFLFCITNTVTAQNNFAKFVDPFIGTGGHGHTYPGAVMPHGMVQLSPDTRLEGWDGCSGYHYSDNYIYGFTHTHLSGTGCSDYGDILLMPMTGEPSPDNKIYGSKFSHTNEKASPGFYSVKLDNNILAELTTTTRVGLHRYTFAAGNKSDIILDLQHRDKVLESSVKIIGDNKVEGMRRSQDWAMDQHIYFVMEFSKPFMSKGIWVNNILENNLTEKNATNIKVWFQFSTKDKEPIMVKVGISMVSIEGARKNLESELPGWNFDQVRTDAEKSWNKELSRIEVSGGSNANLRTFYTALYHTMVVPNVANDVDGEYRGRDNKIHTTNGFTYYTVFSLWDTYRACHPLYTIIDQARTLDYIKTFLTEYKDGGRLPVWELSSNETDCMIGYHSVPVIVDASMKGIDKFDKKLALEAMEKGATGNRYGLSALMDHGYLEAEDENESVSKTLEYAYDDWCIATFAKSTGNENDYNVYIKRAQAYKNLLDPQSGFMRPKKNGNWITPFDPREVNNNFTEANSWQYSFYVPQDISGYTLQLGGRQRLERKLDSLFTETTKTTGREQSDISGQIGQYAHGNEPSHHIIYLYNFTGKAYKTQEKIHQVMTEMYHDAPDGLAGNEDCGQMSAWYVLSAMGFYPVTPGTTDYMIGTPLFKQVVLHLENGKTFTIDAKETSDKNFYIQSAMLNGKAYPKSYFSHFDIMKGGIMSFAMGNKPSLFGSENIPTTAITDDKIVLNPVIYGGEESFYEPKHIKIYSAQQGVKIYYTLNGDDPVISGTNLYRQPFPIANSTIIKSFAVNEKGERSKITTAKFHHLSHNWSIISPTPYEQEYPASGHDAFIDEMKGTVNWRKGNWQGYQKDNLEVIIDLKKQQDISAVTADFLQDTGAWIIMPKEVIVEISTDGKNYKPVYDQSNFLPIEDLKVQIKVVQATFAAAPARYVKLKAVQYGKLPAWHEGAGNDSHLFIDEIEIK